MLAIDDIHAHNIYAYVNVMNRIQESPSQYREKGAHSGAGYQPNPDKKDFALSLEGVDIGS